MCFALKNSLSVRPSKSTVSSLSAISKHLLFYNAYIHMEGRKKGGSKGVRKEIREGKKAEVREEGRNEEK